uniref:Uncharacterized protein n=1 Tax=Acrobeloides nanus TaxID=290746 RepID=A0A914DRR8_9BILA
MPVECNCRKPNKVPFIDPLKGLEDSNKKLVDDDNNGEKDEKESIPHEKENDIENNEQENLPSTLYYVEEDHNEYEVLEEEEENPLLEKSFNEYKFDLSNLVQSLITKMLLIQIKNDLHGLRDWEREGFNNSKSLVDHVKSTIDNFNSNFQSKLAYLMYLKEIIWRDCKIENFILSSQKEYDNHLDYQESNTMDKRAAGDPRATLIARIPMVLTPFLTTQQLGQLFDIVVGIYLNSSVSCTINATSAASLASNTSLVSSLQTTLMSWATTSLDMMQMMSGLGVYNTLTATLNSTDPLTLITNLGTIMGNNLSPFFCQVQDKMAQMKNAGRSQNATLREAFIMCCQFFTKRTVNIIVTRIKNNFGPPTCNAVYTSLNPTFLSLDLYNFTATPCSGTM